MMGYVFRMAVAGALFAAGIQVVVAQPTDATAGPGAAASQRSPTSYRSAFDGYRGYRDEPVGNWRQANDLVRQIGGWQTYAREGQSGEGGEPAAKPEAPAKDNERGKAPAKGGSGNHTGHH